MSDRPHPTVTDWLAELDRQGKSPHTRASYRRALLHFARWSEGAYGQALARPLRVIRLGESSPLWSTSETWTK